MFILYLGKLWYMSGHNNGCEKSYYNIQTRQFESDRLNKNPKMWMSGGYGPGKGMHECNKISAGDF
jgi:hypothetical protein